MAGSAFCLKERRFIMSKKRPNLLYLFADQWRAHAVGYKNEDPVESRTGWIDFVRKAYAFLTHTVPFLCVPLTAVL